jgi:hypothetical protein
VTEERELLHGHAVRYKVVGVRKPEELPDESEWGISPRWIIQMEKVLPGEGRKKATSPGASGGA